MDSVSVLQSQNLSRFYGRSTPLDPTPQTLIPRHLFILHLYVENFLDLELLFVRGRTGQFNQRYGQCFDAHSQLQPRL